MVEASPPQGQQQGPWAPPGPEPLLFDTFDGMNTKPSRPGVDDKECFWIDGFMPFGKNNLRAMWGVGPAAYTSPTPGTIVLMQFGNIGPVPYMLVLHVDGSLDAVNMQTSATTTILPPGTILSPQIGQIGVSQWGNQFLLIVADQSNGYWIWDGTLIYDAGTLAPQVTVDNSGSNYTSQPTITLQVNGTGSGATFDAVLDNGSISQINVTNPGSGFSLTDLVNLVITGGGSDNTATAQATISPDGGVTGVTILNGGNGYSSSAFVQFTGGGGTGAAAALAGSNGSVTQIIMTNPGTGYTSAPTVSIVEPGFVTHPGSGFSGLCVMGYGQVSFVTVTDGGTGYTSNPVITIIGDGQNAVATPVLSGGSLVGITMTNPGFGYTKALVNITGGNNAADATVSLMPFGVQGSGIETYQSRVWITDGAKLFFTAAESLTDVSASGGGGIATSFDSFLRNSYTKPVQTNGFLYLLADSSINYISGVTTAGNPPTTSYTNQNADPEIGTVWPDTIDVFSRNIVFANLFGVHVSYGGAVTKVSDDLDGVYWTVGFFGSFTPSAAKAIHFGVKIWVLLLPIIDPITGVRINKLLCWNGKKWWAASQDMPLTFVQHQELDSVITAYGTDGTTIRPLFAQPSTGFKKTVQSKLWSAPGGFQLNKTSTRLWALAQYYSDLSPALQVTIDAVDDTHGSTSQNYTLTPTTPLPGAYVSPPQAIGQQGALTGLTIETFAADMSLVAMMVTDEAWAYRG